MTCYFRHLDAIFKKAGITVTKENKAELDKIIHEILGVEYKNCPNAWRQVKEQLAKDENEFVTTLRNAWKNRQTKSQVF